MSYFRIAASSRHKPAFFLFLIVSFIFFSWYFPMALNAEESSCVSCHTDEKKLIEIIGSIEASKPEAVCEPIGPEGAGWGGSVAPLEPHKKLLVDPSFLEDEHGGISCETCHGGNPEDNNWKTAHEGIVKDPTYPDAAESCGECHEEIVEKNKTSLHITLAPFKNKIYLRVNPDKNVREKIDSAMDTHCMGCHSSCGQCHISRPSSVGGGLIEGHLFKKPPPMKTNCTSCHGSRIGKEFFGENEGLPADAHYSEHGLECKGCHSGEEMHGSGEAHFDRYEVANRAKCVNCHTGEDDENPSHVIHKDKVSCQVCHSVSYKNCFNCHVGKDKAGKPYSTIGSTVMAFKIGMNPKPTEERPEKYVTVRHIPVNKELFDFYVKGGLTNFDNAPTWKLATPHNIQRQTPQNESCISCHNNSKLFLRKRDVRSKEITANKDVIVPSMPSLFDRHNWLTQAEFHLTNVDCLVCHTPLLKSPIRDCNKCHSKNSILLKKPEDTSKEKEPAMSWDFTNKELMKKGGYVVGSNRIPALDTLGILIVVLTFVGCIGHGCLRFITRRRK
ncbi:MAG: hypothetical protein Q7J27_01705 [Syntrophales bacterium]|nr:hypothetical protein [Syntrophales bacterium]